MYKPVHQRRNSLPSNNMHRCKTKILPKTDYNITKSSKVFHDPRRPKSKTLTCVKQLSYNEPHISGLRNFMDHSLSDGDEVLDNKIPFHKVIKQNHTIKDKRHQILRSQPIDTPTKRVQDIPLHHSPPSYESPQKFGSYKKFKENDIKHLVIEKYALLKQLMNIDESNGDNYYAGAKFSNCPSPGDLPLPPMQWLNSCQAQAKTMQNSALLFNITI